MTTALDIYALGGVGHARRKWQLLAVVAAFSILLVAAIPGSQATFGDTATQDPPAVEGAVAVAVDPATAGTWVVTAAGEVTADGGAHAFGDLSGYQLAAPIVDIEALPSGGGYWLVAGDGGVFAFGGAEFYGSAAGLNLGAPVVGMASTIDGGGYWLTSADGGVFTYGSAQFHGSASDLDLVGPIVGIAATQDGAGYWLAASDGGVFSYGSAPFHGSAFKGNQTSEITGVAVPSFASGYWLVSENGLVPTFGPPVLFAAEGRGTTGVVVDVAATSDGGYVIAVDPLDEFQKFVANLPPGREAIWDRIAHCESTTRWDINTGNGYYGGIQFKLSSWQAVGGTGWPHEASREEQIYRGELLLAIQGWRAWPTCSRRLGLR